MKKKLSFLAACIALCIVLVEVVKILITPGVKDPKSHLFFVGKIFSFEDILKETKISSVREICISDMSKEKNASYFFVTEDKIQEIQKILSEAEYMESTAQLDSAGKPLWVMEYEQADNRVLWMHVFQSEREGLTEVIFGLSNLVYEIEYEYGWIPEYGHKGFFIESEVSDKILELISNLPQISREYITDVLKNVSDMPSMTDFFEFPHETEKKYYDYKTGETYDIYRFPLSDMEGYALIYCIYNTIGNRTDGLRWRDVYKIELYNADKELTETLYDNPEGYEKTQAEMRRR